MCGPMQEAVQGAALFEGWAASAEEAGALAAAGGIRLRPNHDIGCAGPMAGLISPSMQMLPVNDADDADGTGLARRARRLTARRGFS
jgi:hypothetical protein